jgi:hypothetical protein
MKNLKIYLSLFGGLVFNLIFWGESLGLNGLLFTLFLFAGLFGLNRKEIIFSKYTWLTAGGMLTFALLMIWHNSFPSKLGWSVSGLLLVGFSQENSFRSIMYASSSSLQKFFLTGKEFYSQINFSDTQRKDLQVATRYVKLFVLPVIVAIVFFVIFRIANPVFAELTDSIFLWMGESIELLFQLLSPGRLVLMLFGTYISAWFILRKRSEKLAQKEASIPEEVKRKRGFVQRTLHFDFSPIALKNENATGAILMTMVALMATCVNLIDISTLWFNFEIEEGMNLSQLVHEGTYMLIISILLSMGIMLYYFRGNQNFYQKNERLKWLAYIWIVQNAIMVISVCIRNSHYIHHFGLAYKRIGVLLFLGLTLFGLATLTLKIKHKKSAFYLIRTNSWATYALLFALAIPNWDGMIVKHNSSHQFMHNMDAKFLLSLSDKTLPVLIEKQEMLSEVYENNKSEHATSFNFKQILTQKSRRFLTEQRDKTWLSWNYAEWEAEDFLRAEGVTAYENED